MPRRITEINIFVASPGDVAEERKAVDIVVSEINKTLKDYHELAFNVIKWETDAQPGIDVDPQAVINKQIPVDYDIFLGIMCARFGTPTGRAASGTEEEFNRAYERWSAL